MNKTINDITYNNAEFPIITCKQCGAQLTHDKIVSGYVWCSRICQIRYIQYNCNKQHKV